MKKGNKFLMVEDYHFNKSCFKKGDVIEFVGKSSSSHSRFTNQDGVGLKKLNLWVEEFLKTYTDPL